jgi:hypothetical protein
MNKGRLMDALVHQAEGEPDDQTYKLCLPEVPLQLPLCRPSCSRKPMLLRRGMFLRRRVPMRTRMQVRENEGVSWPPVS